MTLPSVGRTRITVPSLPRSLPLSTTTRSPLRIFIAMSQHLRCERHDAHEALLTKLATHGPEDAGATRGLVVLDEHGGVLVEADVAAVRAALLLLRADDDALHDVALLHGRAGDRVLHGRHED